MTYRHTPQARRAPLVRVTRRSPCPVCQKPDNCAVSADGRIAYCRRKPSDRKGRDGGWTHFLSGEPLPVAPARPLPEPSPRRDAAHCHAVYSALLSSFGLGGEDREHLLVRRGLSEGAILRNAYASMPAPGRALEVCRSLSDRFDLRGVPGFWLDEKDGAWKLSYCAAGILVPVRDVEERIVALQLRRDHVPDGTDLRYVLLSSTYLEGGANSSAPVHFRNVEAIHKSGRALITEGALKGDVISDRLGEGVVAVSGVSSFRQGFGGELRRLLPSLRQADVCFDSDWRTNRHVKGAIFRLLRELSSARVAASVRTWPSRHKGFDDYLVEGRAPAA
jgi:hypothetical protein